MKKMKIEIPIVGIRNGQPVLDNIFENVCETAVSILVRLLDVRVIT